MHYTKYCGMEAEGATGYYVSNAGLDWGGVGEYFSQEVTFKLMAEGKGEPGSRKCLCVGGGAELQPREEKK